jgi:hypothetical protein
MPTRASFSSGRTPASSLRAPESVWRRDHCVFAPAKYFKNSALNVARWNGSVWAALGGGVSGEVRSLAVAGSESWAALGSGLNDWVFALAVVDRDVHAGGWFTQAGGRQSIHFGIWHEPVTPRLTITFNSQHSTLNVSWPASSTGWTLQPNTNGVGSLNWSNVTSGIQDDGTNKTRLLSYLAGTRFYRLHKP